MQEKLQGKWISQSLFQWTELELQSPHTCPEHKSSDTGAVQQIPNARDAQPSAAVSES